MLGRLLLGIVKGLVLGGLLGFGLLKLGQAVPIAVVAYVAAAVTGILIGLVAGKPIWAKDAKIEAGMKAGVGALLGVGLMFAARRWLTMPVPGALLDITRAQIQGAAPALGMFSMTSLAAIAAVLGGFYDADNTPEPEKAEAEGNKAAAPNKARIAQPPNDEEFEEEHSEEPEKKKGKK